jgi:hypothetical protein
LRNEQNTINHLICQLNKNNNNEKKNNNCSCFILDE